jgi:hypothetical protein
MSSLLITTLLLFSSLSYASIRDCHREITQSEKNECMAFERDQAVGRLMTKVTEDCAKDDEVKDAKGGSIYPMLVDECMAKRLDRLAKRMDGND